MTRWNCFGYCCILDEDAEEKKEILVVAEKSNSLSSSSFTHQAAGSELGETSTRQFPRTGNFLFTCSADKTKSDSNKEASAPEYGPTAAIAAQIFSFQELEAVTKNFSEDCHLGGKDFGPLYKGCLENTGQVVAVRKLDRDANREFLVEVLTLSLLHHTNLVNLVGYCADGDHRLLVYEFMPLGSLEDNLHDLPPTKKPLDWNSRVKIAAGAAKSLEYLHGRANPPVIHRNFKPSNILLDEEYNPKLSGFRFAKLAPVDNSTHVSTRVMGTYGYCAPEYVMTGQLTLKCDVYSFGVVLLELITGRKVFDNTRSPGERDLVAWARPLFRSRMKFPDMVDPLLENHYPSRGLHQVLAVAAMCLQEEAAARPDIQDVVIALSRVASQTYEPEHIERSPSINANNQAAEGSDSGSDIVLDAAENDR